VGRARSSPGILGRDFGRRHQPHGNQRGEPTRSILPGHREEVCVSSETASLAPEISGGFAISEHCGKGGTPGRRPWEADGYEPKA